MLFLHTMLNIIYNKSAKGRQNKTKMYILKDKITGKLSIYKEKTVLGNKLSCSTRTILRNQDKYSWDWKGYAIINPEYVQGKSKRGG